MGRVSPVGMLSLVRSHSVRAARPKVHSSRGASFTWKYGWKPMATGMGAVLRLLNLVRTSRTPLANR